MAADPAPQPLRLAGDHRVSATTERNPYLAPLFDRVVESASRQIRKVSTIRK
jgi:hypothetical protein